MDSLIEKLGRPPYQLDQILPLLREASSSSETPKSMPTNHKNDTPKIVESLEALARLVDFSFAETFPQFSSDPTPESIELNGPHIAFHVPPTKYEVLDSFALETMKHKNEMFDRLELPVLPLPAFGSAQVCHHCNWAFEHLARGPCDNKHLPGDSESALITESFHLISIDEWPDFPILEQRAARGCNFCQLLRESLPSLDVLPRNPSRQRVKVWLSTRWRQNGMQRTTSEETSSLLVTVSLKAMSDFSGDRDNLYCENGLQFTVDTSHGTSGWYNLRCL